MQAPVLHHLEGQRLWLSAERAIFWEEKKALVVSDLHLGKTGHFRKAGIAVPQSVFKEDMQRLLDLIQHFKPTQIIAVGDLFHSNANLELQLFQKWFTETDLHFILVRGNHDILKDHWYKQLNIEVIENSLDVSPFSFTHDNCARNTFSYSFCGHIHPGIELNGLGRQILRFPCFYFTKDHCILPAFSKFTGMVSINPRTEETVYAIVENKVMEV